MGKLTNTQSDQTRTTVPTLERSTSGDVAAFIKAAKDGIQPGSGRLIFALDATMSRQATWDMACDVQARMFEEAGRHKGLAVQLIYFRGMGECRASKFVTDTASLRRLMTGLACQGGLTQIGKVMARALSENEKSKVSALVFVGDAMEENVDHLASLAGQLGLRGVPVFLFQEGHDAGVETAFKEFARLSRGAWFRLDRNAPSVFADLLSSIAVFATGGIKALTARGRKSDQLLLQNLGSRK